VPVIVAYVLTALGALAVLLTRIRLRRSHAGWPLTVHTIAGAIAVVLWLLFLISHDGSLLGKTPRNVVGVIALAFWWMVVATGLMLLVRWLPSRSRGKRAATTVDAADSWTGTPWLSVLAHVGMLLGVMWFTWAYAFSVI
jgi:cobalamin synthase